MSDTQDKRDREPEAGTPTGSAASGSPALLSPRQRTTVATALTLLATCSVVAVVVVFVVALGRFVNYFSGVLTPLAAAAIVALVLRPYYEWVRTRVRGSRSGAAVAVIVTVPLPFLAFLWFFGAALVQEIDQLVETYPQWSENLTERLKAHWPAVVEFWQQHGLTEKIRQAIETHAGTLLTGAQTAGRGLYSAGISLAQKVAALLGWAVFPVYLFFFLVAEPLQLDKIETALGFLKPRTRRDLIYLAREFVNILVAFFRGQLLIALIQGILFAIGFSLAGLKYGFALGLTLGILNIVPYLGNMIGLGVAIPLAYLQPDGGLQTLLFVLLAFAAVQTIDGYLITPRIMGSRTGLHPMVIIVAIFFWGTAFSGVAGMVLAIPLTAFLVVFWRLLRTRYLVELV